jgi:hypothetical protein
VGEADVDGERVGVAPDHRRLVLLRLRQLRQVGEHRLHLLLEQVVVGGARRAEAEEGEHAGHAREGDCSDHEGVVEEGVELVVVAVEAR